MQLLVAAVLALAASVAAAEDPGATFLGSGLLTLPSTATLSLGHVRIGIGVDIKDRDPLNLDIAEYSTNVAFGLGPRCEAYGHLIVSSVIAVPEAPVLPPPPLDVVVLPGQTAPSRPYYAIYAQAPYVNKRLPDTFKRFVPGQALAGAKLRLTEARGARPALALSFDVAFPLTRALHKLQESAGTDTFDIGTRLGVDWMIGRSRLLATARFVRVGPPKFGDQTIAVESGRATTIDEPLRLPSRVELGVGFEHPFSHRVAALAEAATSYEVGARTPTVYNARPFDLLGGLRWQGRHGWVTAGVRYEARIPPTNDYPSPLAGWVDLTDVAAGDLAAYLRAIGGGAALRELRPQAQHVVRPPDGTVPLPPGARVIPPTYRIRSDDHHFLNGVDLVVTFGVTL